MTDAQFARYRVEVFYTKEDPRGLALTETFINLGFPVSLVYFTDNYLLNIDLNNDQIIRAAESLIQPVTQNFFINRPYIPDGFQFCIEIGFLPGVTDNISHTVREMLEDLFKMNFDRENAVFYTNTYFFNGIFSDTEIQNIARELYNPLIQKAKILNSDEYIKVNGFGHEIPVVRISEKPGADEININISDESLIKIGLEGIENPDGGRRGPLALDNRSMQTIKKYFLSEEGRNPTDIELESIAQTWSEHCKHTIFAASIDDDTPEGIFKTCIREATMQIMHEKGDSNFCVSVFTDNSGGIIFDDNYIISDKVETHNSPSALDPFGGAVTGIVGVNRDAIGFGLAAKPIANRYGFCFADPHDDRPIYKNDNKDSRMLPPRRIMDGVIKGVNTGGNTSGIPTPQGFIYFDERYKGKPLVFVGTVGLIPRTVCGKSSVEKKARPGDYIIMAGGRVGRDGIHGATFSSEALSSGSPATAVQIGDPITQKKMSDAIIKEARDAGLYNSITDNGAGGLSCSVAEMAKECGGFIVELENVPVKYPGLSPWQIWVSESQERMTLSVSRDKAADFISLMERRGVEATVIGEFTSSGRGIVRYNGSEIFNLDMNFLHEGLPQKALSTKKPYIVHEQLVISEPDNHTDVLHAMLSRLNLCSFEFISSQYDHEVQGGSVLKPLHGRGRVNSNVTVIRPLLNSWKGVVLSHGIFPSYGDIDMYWMSACSIDTAVRNSISAGATLDHLAILDNFCWCDSNNPERLWQLKESARGCFDYAVAYGTPFISGKDSMFNDFHGFDEYFNKVQISIPPTLLISSIGVIDDIRKSVTLDFKLPGDIIYIIGITGDDTGGSEYNAYIGESRHGRKFLGTNVPKVDSVMSVRIYRAVEKAIKNELFSSCLSIERGGLAIAAAKSSIAGRCGFTLKLENINKNITRNDTLLYSESQGRFLVTINPDNMNRFEDCFKTLPFLKIGHVTDDFTATVSGIDGDKIIYTTVDRMENFYKKTFKDY